MNPMSLTRLLPARLAAAAALACAVALPAAAQQNLEKLKQFKVATTDLNIPVCRRPAATPTRSAPT
jgi:hypothetical protein